MEVIISRILEVLQKSNAVTVRKTHDSENNEYTKVEFFIQNKDLFSQQVGIKGIKRMYWLSVEYVINIKGYPNIYKIEFHRELLPDEEKTWGNYKNEKNEWKSKHTQD